MVTQQTKSARDIAIAVLRRFDPTNSYASSILNKLIVQTNEKQRATDLVFGTLRNLSAIDMVIAKFADCPVERITPKLLPVIRIAAYEIIYCPATAEYAIVNEAVASVKKVFNQKQAGFVNAVLRQILRNIKNRQIELSKASVNKNLPQNTSFGCEFNSDILPDMQTSPTENLSSAFSLPKWLVADWLEQFGFEKTKQICFASNRRPSIYIRANTLKITTQKLAQKFHDEAIDFEFTADEPMIRLKGPAQVRQLPGFNEGLFNVQDITASQAVCMLNTKREWSILDLCTAPGGKTIQLAQQTFDKATIIVTDIDADRLEMVKENITRLGIKSVNIVNHNNLQQTFQSLGPFDCVVLDVPCSNTGVLAKRIEARFRISKKAIHKITETQINLLKKASKMIKPNGTILYSTCSIQSSENTELIKKFLQKNQDFKLQSEKLTLPSAQRLDHDGGFVAIIKR